MPTTYYSPWHLTRRGVAAVAQGVVARVPGDRPAGLKRRSRDPAERELIRTRAKLGEMTMRMELAKEPLEKRGYGDEPKKLSKRGEGSEASEPKKRGPKTKLSEEARQVIGTFIERCNHGWILERHGYKTPTQARDHLTRMAA